MSAITHRMADPVLAGIFAKKWLGKSGMVRCRAVKAASIGVTYNVYEIGTVSPDGDFLIKADSAYDYHECFNRLGRVIDDHDPIYIRHIVGEMAKQQDPGPEQVEMFA